MIVLSDPQPDPELVEHFRERLNELGLAGQPQAYAFTLGWMQSWVAQTARDHAAECTLGVCGTCKEFSEALSMIAAFNIEFPEILGGNSGR